MAWASFRNDRYTTAYPSFTNIKLGYNGVVISRTCFLDVRDWRLTETWNTYQNFGVGQVHMLVKPNP